MIDYYNTYLQNHQSIPKKELENKIYPKPNLKNNCRKAKLFEAMVTLQASTLLL